MDRVVFRVSPLGVLAALAFAVCATPVALGAPGLAVLYLLPIGLIVWVLRTRTVVDGEAVTVRRLLSTRRVPWDAVTSLRLQPTTRLRGSRVSAVLTDGSQLPLPAVRVRNLPQLAAASAGRLPDPSESPEPATPEPATPEPASPDPARAEE